MIKPNTSDRYGRPVQEKGAQIGPMTSSFGLKLPVLSRILEIAPGIATGLDQNPALGYDSQWS